MIFFGYVCRLILFLYEVGILMLINLSDHKFDKIFVNHMEKHERLLDGLKTYIFLLQLVGSSVHSFKMLWNISLTFWPSLMLNFLIADSHESISSHRTSILRGSRNLKKENLTGNMRSSSVDFFLRQRPCLHFTFICNKTSWNKCEKLQTVDLMPSWHSRNIELSHNTKSWQCWHLCIP